MELSKPRKLNDMIIQTDNNQLLLGNETFFFSLTFQKEEK